VRPSSACRRLSPLARGVRTRGLAGRPRGRISSVQSNGNWKVSGPRAGPPIPNSAERHCDTGPISCRHVGLDRFGWLNANGQKSPGLKIAYLECRSPTAAGVQTSRRRLDAALARNTAGQHAGHSLSPPCRGKGPMDGRGLSTAIDAGGAHHAFRKNDGRSPGSVARRPTHYHAGGDRTQASLCRCRRKRTSAVEAQQSLCAYEKNLLGAVAVRNV